MRVHLLGGFLGAGKTTVARALAGYLRSRGERVAIVTNDQGRSLVDTQLARAATDVVAEVTGGCFCCRYDDLEAALLGAAQAGATTAIAESVGSCADLIATVMSPLVDRHPGRFTLAPLTVVVDPWRAREMELGEVFDADVAYLFRKQVEEADVVLLSRADQRPPDVRAAIRAINPGAAIVSVAAIHGDGLDAWMGAAPSRPSAPLDLDYDRYAAAEAALGWANATVRISSTRLFDEAAAARYFLGGLREEPIAHVKVSRLDDDRLWAALVRRGAAPIVQSSDLAPVRETTWLINARVALPPALLRQRVEAALAHAVQASQVAWEAFECFQPSRPVPTHRYAVRCGSGDDASCCAAFYDRPDVRLLLGDSLHPGGTALTLRVAARLGLVEAATLLDVACGRGASLAAVLGHYPARGIGLDAAARPRPDAGLTVMHGDAHRIPLDDGTADAVLCECALSTFTDQSLALREMRRVLRSGGRLGVSDMLVTGPIPDRLRDWVHLGTCLTRAATLDHYAALIEGAGFRVVDRWAEPAALQELLRRIKRNLVGAALAAATGALGEVRVDVTEGRELLREAERVVRNGTVGYGVLIAEAV